MEFECTHEEAARIPIADRGWQQLLYNMELAKTLLNIDHYGWFLNPFWLHKMAYTF